MKNLFYLISCLITICLSGCSNDITDQSSDVVTKSEVLESEYTPYISPQMQNILSMIDTCTTAIPIEKLIPLSDTSLNSSSTSKVLTKSDDGTLVATGYTSSSTLYTRVKTIVDDTQADNFNIAAGTYYITCKSVAKYLSFSGLLDPARADGDVMGVNPDDLSQVGYKAVQKSSTVYLFTTYIWGLSLGSTSDYEISEWIPRIPSGSGYLYFNIASDFMSNLQWRYISLN